MEAVSLSPAHVAALLFRRDAKRWALTVVCKATFELAPGEMRFARQQDVINEQDERWEHDDKRSVHAPSDLAPFKGGCDVTLVGHAFAPRGERVRSLVARLVCGSIDKTIAVYGDRAQANVEPALFTRMALRYERAWGGPGTANPAGVSRGARLPNLETAASAGEVKLPVGFGPIAPDWPERRRRMGRPWRADDPLPDDLAPDFFNVAPVDQRLSSLRDDQEIVLEHLHPEIDRLVTRLPGMKPIAFVDRPRVKPEPLAMIADGLWIDTDRARCTVTWRATIELADRNEPGRVLVGLAGARQTISFDDLARADRTASTSVVASSSASMEDEDGYIPTVAMKRPKPAPPPSEPTLLEETLPPIESIAVKSASIESPTNTQLFAGGRFDASPAWLASERPARAEPRAIEVRERAVEAPRREEPKSPWAATASPTPLAQTPTLASALPIVPAIIDAASSSSRAPRADSSPRAALDLVWFDPASLPRIRARWPKIVDDLDFEPLDPRHDLPAGDPAASRDRHHAFGVLTRAEIVGAGAVGHAMGEAVDGAGRFTPPLLALAGDLRLPLDDVETLRTTAAAAKPLAKDDKRLADLLGDVGDLLDSPLLEGAPGVVEGLLREVREAVRQSKRTLPVKFLDQHVDRVLLEQRKWQRRTVFGELSLRALLSQGGAPIPAYLPDDLAKRLPLAPSFKVRILAEAHPAADAFETHPLALRIVALARALDAGAWR